MKTQKENCALTFGLHCISFIFFVELLQNQIYVLNPEQTKARMTLNQKM